MWEASHDKCPSCHSQNTKVNKSYKAHISRICGDCGAYYNVPKITAENYFQP